MFANSPGGIFCCSRGETSDQRTGAAVAASPDTTKTISTRSACKACNAGTFSSFEVGHTSADQCLLAGLGGTQTKVQDNTRNGGLSRLQRGVQTLRQAGTLPEGKCRLRLKSAKRARLSIKTLLQVNCKECVGGGT